MIHRSSVRGTNVRTVVELARALSELARWAEQRHLGPLRLWDDNAGLGFVDLEPPGEPPSDGTWSRRAGALRALHVYRQLLPGGGLGADPFSGQALPKAIGYRQSDVSPGPSFRGQCLALRAPRGPTSTPSPTTSSTHATSGSGSRNTRRCRMPQRRCWRPGGGDGSAIVPLHTTAGFWAETNRTGGCSRCSSACPSTCSTVGNPAQWQRAQAHARDLVGRGRTIRGGLGEPLARVTRREVDGTVARRARRSLAQEGADRASAAAYVFIAAISGMRDSEIQDLERGCLAVGHAGPVLRSRKWKHSDGRPATWAVIDPVARAIEVLKRLSRHETHLFAPFFKRAGSTRRAGIEANHDIEVFIDHVNGIAESAGLETIHAARVTTPHVPPHLRRHRRRRAVRGDRRRLAAQARRQPHPHHPSPLGSGRHRLGHDIATEQTRSAIDALYQSFSGYLDGGTIAGGGGARRTAFFAGIAAEVAERFPGQTGDDEVIKPFLRTAAQNFYPGTLNNYGIFDASLALCLTSLDPSERSAPVLSACQPGQCPNATIEEKHGPVWVAARGRLADLLARPGPVRTEAGTARRRACRGRPDHFDDQGSQAPRWRLIAPRRSSEPPSAGSSVERPCAPTGASPVADLAREAELSRATAHRYPDVLKELAAASQRAAPSKTTDDSNSDLADRNARLAAENSLLRAEKEAMANAIYALTEVKTLPM